MKSATVLFCLLPLLPAYAFDGGAFSGARCRAQVESNCNLEWDMSSTPRAAYVIERYDIEESAWQTHVANLGKHSGVTNEAMPTGTLLRVRGCDDFARDSSCVASNVEWVPFFAKSMDELPDFVAILPHGIRMTVPKNESLNSANFGYNVALVTNVANTISGNDITPMRPPALRLTPYENPKPEEVRAVGGLTIQLHVHNEVYGIWERMIQRNR